ncbi:MAG: TrkH family potassium uptake protein, partial [Spirochaetales bacterium]|nr:TrkH family potassium uptake protein [Candidatus Physcosoma equi]
NPVVALLIILGAMGFFVMSVVLHSRVWSKFSFHTKIALSTSLVLVFGGMALLWAFGMKPLEAFFLTVSTRTAGFNTVPFEDLSNASMVVVILLMFIGANPGSTGGGVKTTTIFVIALMMFSVPSGRKPTAFKRRIPAESILKAFAVAFLALVFILVGTIGIMLTEGDSVPGLAIVFEVVSAVATVGLSRSLTPLLTIGSKIILMFLMFVGRLGPLTIASFFTGEKTERLEYLEEHVLIG